MTEEIDDFNKILAQMARQNEQAEAGTESFAKIAALFWQTLHRSGVLSSDDCTILTKAWLVEVMKMNGSNNG